MSMMCLNDKCRSKKLNKKCKKKNQENYYSHKKIEEGTFNLYDP